MNEEIKEYDGRGNLIHLQGSFEYEYWYKYDENDNKVYLKRSDGYEIWYEYDEYGNLIREKDSKGEEYFYKYDENNTQIEITQQEFEKIKRKNSRELINTSKISRFELMDI